MLGRQPLPPPYYKGDQWLSDSGEISTCIRDKAFGGF